jgi:hypothetical protein
VPQESGQEARPEAMPRCAETREHDRWLPLLSRLVGIKARYWLTEAGGENGRRPDADDDAFSLLHRSQMFCQVVVLHNDKAGATDQEAD